MARKIVVLLGPPGSGKGTQAKLVAAHCGLPHLSTGDMLRAAVGDGSEFGAHIKRVMASGALVSDEIIIDLLRRRIIGEDCFKGLLLDGFPRTLKQARDLESLLGQENSLGVILIRVSPEAIKRRLVGRRTCVSCGKIFNVYENPSKRGESCDNCGSPLIQREDDREEVVNERLEVYTKQTEPLVVYYKELGLLHALDGERNVGDIHRDLVSILKSI